MSTDAQVLLELARLQGALLEYATEFLVFVNERGEVVVGAGEGLSILGYGPTERRGRHIAEHLHPDDLPRVLAVIEAARSRVGNVGTLRVRARGRAGDWHPLEAAVITVDHAVLGRGAVIRVRAVEEDEESVLADDRFLGLAEALPSGVVSADARGRVVYANHAARQLLGLPEVDLRGTGWTSAIERDDVADVLDAAAHVIRTGVAQQCTFRVQAGLFVRWASGRFVPLGDGDRRTGWILALEDVTERRRAESLLAHRATHDPLTDLPDRTLFEDRLEQACARMRRDPGVVAVLFVDLDDFKSINDAHGHDIGDDVLREVARRLRTVLRPADTVARLGGDEFVVICEGLGARDCEQVADRIAASLTAPMTSHHLTVTASVGVAVTTDQHAYAADLLARADQAMYRRKRERGEVSAG